MGTLLDTSTEALQEGDIIFIGEVGMYGMVTADDEEGLIALVVLDEDAHTLDTLAELGVMLAYRIQPGEMYGKLIEEDV